MLRLLIEDITLNKGNNEIIVQVCFNTDFQCATKAPVSLVAESATGKVQTKYISYRALSTQRQRSVLSVGREVVGRKRKLK